MLLSSHTFPVITALPPSQAPPLLLPAPATHSPPPALSRCLTPAPSHLPQKSPPPTLPKKGPCVSADHGLQPLTMTSVHRAPRTRTEHARHAVDWLEGRVLKSKVRIHHEMRRAPEPQTTAAAFFVTSSALGILTHLKIVLLSQTYLRPPAARPYGGCQ